jgi:hypothetical protein
MNRILIVTAGYRKKYDKLVKNKIEKLLEHFDKNIQTANSNQIATHSKNKTQNTQM